MRKTVSKENLIYYKIGDRIRKHRKEKDLKLLELAAEANISSAMLSKIENGRMIPTIPTLFAIINKLDVSPEVFFSELNNETKFPGYIFIPKADYASYVKEENASGFDYYSILEHVVSVQSFQLSLLELSPNAKRPLVTTAGFEYIYLIKGSVKYFLEDKYFKMTQGDSLFFDGNIPHVPINESKKPSLLLVLYLFTEPK
ncbi:XRE family transcriptional regulator [Agriterribacter sp.]|uniref:helix-turn-helix domain-containing protein n=1 Tax=Agriterribacter sp. TaxID=2821509 RepID=UPI002C1402A0|nr:XRE family transcriptional regulator [Agriterribacter sp.]HTN07428.1 XRE family transcriptional regulator [Agriterribacter sp.]